MISFKLISDSIFSPKVAFQRIVNFEIKLSVLVEATIFIALVNAIFSYISNYLFTKRLLIKLIELVLKAKEELV